MITTLVAFAIPAAISIYEAIAYALAAGAITAGVVESTKRYDEWKTNRRQTEAFTYNRTPPLTPAQLHKKKTLTTQEIVPEYVDVSPHNVVEIKEGNDAPANVSVTVPKHVAKTLPTRSLVLHTQTPSGLVGKVSPLILDAEAIALGARKLYDLSQVPLAKSVDLSTGVTPISAEQLIVSVPTPPDPKDPK